MKECKGFVSSIYNGTAIDGPGIRCIVFLAGCNMRCPFCHNPETFDKNSAEEFSPQKLLNRILRYKNYIKKGGVTFSGGEPFLQADFCAVAAELIKEHDINIAVETNCSIIHKGLLRLSDIVIADIKNQCGDIKDSTIRFLDVCSEMSIPVSATNVLVKGVNDTAEKLKELKTLLNRYNNITRFDFLPFKKLCVSKYKDLDIPFPYAEVEETEKTYADKVTDIFNTNVIS